MSPERIGIISLGMIAMMLQMLWRRKKIFREIAIWKIVALSVLLTITGVAGTMVLYWIETGSFGGTSFYGAVLFVPILMLPTMLLDVPYKKIMNLCAPAECLMLAIMKIDCLESNCCFGKYIPELGFQFPSQIVEMIVAVIIMAVLMRMELRKPNTHLYAWYLIIYGAIRFVLNGFRYGIKPFIWILPSGHVWSLLAILIGIIWLFTAKKLAAKKQAVQEA